MREVRIAARVEVPPDLLPADITLTASVPEWIAREGLPAGMAAIGEAVAFGPSGTRFARPVRVCLPYDPDELQRLGVLAERLKVFRLVEPVSVAQPLWEALPSIAHPTSREVCAQTDHFSVFGLGGDAAGGGGSGTDGGGSGGAGGGAGGGSGGVGGCYVASSAFGSRTTPEVEAMMAVRRRYLEPWALGQRLVAFYDAVGPAWARRLDAHPRFKAPARLMLRPIVRLCRWLTARP